MGQVGDLILRKERKKKAKHSTKWLKEWRVHKVAMGLRPWIKQVFRKLCWLWPWNDSCDCHLHLEPSYGGFSFFICFFLSVFTKYCENMLTSFFHVLENTSFSCTKYVGFIMTRPCMRIHFDHIYPIYCPFLAPPPAQSPFQICNGSLFMSILLTLAFT